MGTTKTEVFEKADTKIAELAKALGHPARIAILKYIISRNECICGEIVDEIPLAQATISQHLLELKKAGLIKGQIQGAKSCYCVNEKGWNEAQELLNELFNSRLPVYECCEPDDNCC